MFEIASHDPGERAFPSRWRPCDAGSLPLNYSGNPGVNGVSYRGVGRSLAQRRVRQDRGRLGERWLAGWAGLAGED